MQGGDSSGGLPGAGVAAAGTWVEGPGERDWQRQWDVSSQDAS